MKKTLLVIFCLTASTLYAQTPIFDWAFGLGGTYYDKGIDVATDSAGNVYALGSFANTVDFDPGSNVLNLTSNNNSDDVYIAKYNAAKDLLWALVFGGTGNETPIAMALDASGNCYLTGRFSGTVDFDPGAGTANITASGAFDVFIVKLSPSGIYLWAKNFGGTFGTFVDEISVDDAGSVYTAGTFQTTTDFDPSPAVFNLVSTGGQDPYLAKLDAAGNFVWALNTGFNISKLYCDINNSLFIAGGFNDTTDFDLSSSQTLNIVPSGNYDIYISKYDTAANLIWVKTMGSTGSSGGVLGITTDMAGNIIATGTFSGTLDFDPGTNTVNLTSSGSGSTLSDMYFLKLDAAANFVWVKKIGGNNLDYPLDVATDNAGSIYLTGVFKSSVVDFDPDTTVTFNLNGTMGSYDAFVLILSATGNFIYAYEIGGPSNGDDYGNGICVNPSGSYYVTGTFYGPIDFNPGAGTTTLNDNGNTDAFIQKMNFSLVGLVDTDEENYFSVYPNPANQIVTINLPSVKNQSSEVKVFDAIGKEILSTRVAGGNSTIDVSKLDKGIYFIQLTANTENQKHLQVKKLIVND